MAGRSFQVAMSSIAQQKQPSSRGAQSLGRFPAANSSSTPYTAPIPGSMGIVRDNRPQLVSEKPKASGKKMAGVSKASTAGSRKKRRGNKGAGGKDEDGDVVMGATRTAQQAKDKKKSRRKRGKGKNKPQSKVQEKKKGMLRSAIKSMHRRFCYQVTVPNPYKASMDDIEQLLRSNCPEDFHVMKRRETKNSVIFTLPPVNERAANTLRRLNGRLMVGQDQQPLTITVKQTQLKTNEPSFMLPPEVLSPRYDPVAKHLNLSGFAKDPAMKQFLPPDGLNSFDLANAIMNVIKKHCSDLVTLDLSENELRSFLSWRRLGNVAKQLENLSLAGNEIRAIKDLAELRTCRNIKVLVLLNNPCVVKFGNDREAYEKAVRKQFKKLEELDQLPVSRKAESAPRPSSAEQMLLPQQNMGDPNIIAGVRDFLSRYFSVFDEGRERLMHAYNEGASFQLHIPSVGKGKTSLRGFAPPKKKGKRVVTSKKGPVDIVSLLKKFPNTTHQNAAEVSVCINEATDAGIQCTISGRLQQHTRKAPLQRIFRREFQLVPAAEASPASASGWPCVIQSEVLSLAEDPTVNATSTSATAAVAAAPPAPAGAPAVDPQQQQAMVQQLCADTGMNPTYSEECLKGNNWQYDAAVANFQELQASNALPAEAFQ